MTLRDLFNVLLSAERVVDVANALAVCREQLSVELVPFGRRDNNRGAIEVATDPARSAIERVTNAHDALLELEHERHAGKPVCRSPREAASTWLGVPEKHGLAGLSPKKRQDLAALTVIRLEPGEGPNSRILTVEDHGIGIAPADMAGTILSLNESNKIQKHYLAGTYGQGGASTLTFSKYAFIASRRTGNDIIAFTVVWHQDLPADQYKTGRYVYLTIDGQVPVVKANKNDLEWGTIVRHFGYDLSSYNASIGPRSLYGALQRVLFDPVAPIRFENRVAGWNRTIKGARNALNGAVDHGDESSRGPDIDYSMPMFNISLGDQGEIGVEYWVLARQRTKDGRTSNTKPSRAFVDDSKPIILSHNGQNQGEMSGKLIKKDADLPYLQTQGRLIVHVNCDRLSPTAKRMLFSSTREQWRESYIQNAIEKELVSYLKSEDELRRINEKARDESLREKDDASEKQIRRQVARLLKITGPALAPVAGTRAEGESDPPRKKGKGKPPEPIETKDPPTYIRIVADDDEPIKFHVGQRKYIRIETDANSHYHDPDEPSNSRLNVIVGDDLEVFGTSPLREGRLRIGVRAKTEVAVGSTGDLRVELYRPGASTLSDERRYQLVEPPKPHEGEKKKSFPQFKLIRVDGPTDERWVYVNDDTEDNDITRHASGAQMTEGVLYVYYSSAFPRFASEKARLEQQNPAMAQSFERRYELWLAIHALLKHADEEAAPDQQLGESDESKEMARQERCRIASIAAMVAAQEVKSGVAADDEDA